MKQKNWVDISTEELFIMKREKEAIVKELKAALSKASKEKARVNSQLAYRMKEHRDPDDKPLYTKTKAYLYLGKRYKDLTPKELYEYCLYIQNKRKIKNK